MSYLKDPPRVFVLVVLVLRVHRLQLSLQGRGRKERGLEELGEAVRRALELRGFHVKKIVRRLRRRVLQAGPATHDSFIRVATRGAVGGTPQWGGGGGKEGGVSYFTFCMPDSSIIGIVVVTPLTARDPLWKDGALFNVPEGAERAIYKGDDGRSLFAVSVTVVGRQTEDGGVPSTTRPKHPTAVLLLSVLLFVRRVLLS